MYRMKPVNGVSFGCRMLAALSMATMLSCATAPVAGEEVTGAGDSPAATETAAAFQWPAATPTVTAPAYFAETPVELYSLSENFPLLNDVLRIPAAFTEALRGMDDAALKAQLHQWELEQPPNIVFRKYEDAQHINTWYRRLLLLEVLGSRASDDGRWAREQLKAFYVANAGERLHGIVFEPRRSLLASLAALDRKQAVQLNNFYQEIAELPRAFATGYERLARSEFAVADSDDARRGILRDLAAVLLKARDGAHLQQVAMSLVACGEADKDKAMLVTALCLQQKPSCEQAAGLAVRESVELPPVTGAILDARDLLKSADSIVNDPKAACEQRSAAGWRLFRSDLASMAAPMMQTWRETCAPYPEFWSMAAHVGLEMYGMDTRMVGLLGQGNKATPWKDEYLTVSLYAHYLQSLPLLFNVVQGPQPFSPTWYFTTGPGKVMDEQLTAYGVNHADKADFVRLVLKVLSLRSGDDPQRSQSELNTLAQEALKNADEHPGFPLFRRLALILFAQRSTGELTYLLDSGEGVPLGDPSSLLILLPHMLKRGSEGKGIPAWYDTALKTLKADNPIRIQVENGLLLQRATRSKKLVKDAVRNYFVDVSPDDRYTEADVPRIASRFFNIRSLLALHRMADPPRYGSKNEITPWPMTDYWSNEMVFPGQYFFDALKLYHRKKYAEAVLPMKNVYSKTALKAEKLASSWWLADMMLKLKQPDAALAHAAGVVTIYNVFHDSILLDPKNKFMLTLSDTAFDFNLKPKSGSPADLVVDLTYRFRPHLFVLPKRKLSEYQKMAKKLEKSSLVVPQFKDKDKAEGKAEGKAEADGKSKAESKGRSGAAAPAAGTQPQKKTPAPGDMQKK